MSDSIVDKFKTAARQYKVFPFSKMLLFLAQQLNPLASRFTSGKYGLPDASSLNAAGRNLSITALIVGLTACGGGGGSDAPASTSNSTANANNTSIAPPSNNGTPVPVAANVTLNWPIPMDREDGSVLPAAEIAGYEIIYHNSEDEYKTVNVPDPLQTQYTFANLAPDDYRFAILTYDSDDRVSEASTLVNISKSQFPRL